MNRNLASLRLLSAAGVLVLGLGACGGDDQAGDDAGSDAPAAEADGDAVAIVDFAFEPEQLTVDAGATVTWTNEGDVPHTATSADGEFDSGNLEAGAAFEHTFDEAGEYAYQCDIHPSMEGTVLVE